MSVMDNVKSMAKSVTGNIDKAVIQLGGFSDLAAGWMDPDAGLAIEVELPFNPTSIRIDAVAGGSHKVSTTNGIAYQAVDPRIQISFTAYVDEVNNYDAFLFERVNTGGTGVGLVRTAAHLVQDTEYSVATYVEGLLAALRKDSYSTILFRWGNMEYAGTLNSVDAKYTMFNPNGNPIKAEIAIKILCVSKDQMEQTVEWRRKYEKALRVLVNSDTGSQSIDLADSSAIRRFINF